MWHSLFLWLAVQVTTKTANVSRFVYANRPVCAPLSELTKDVLVVDKETILKLVGELYLDNAFLRKQLDELTHETNELRALVESLQPEK